MSKGSDAGDPSEDTSIIGSPSPLDNGCNTHQNGHPGWIQQALNSGDRNRQRAIEVLRKTLHESKNKA